MQLYEDHQVRTWWSSFGLCMYRKEMWKHYCTLTSMTSCLLMASSLPRLSREIIGSVLTCGPVHPSLRRFKVCITTEATLSFKPILSSESVRTLYDSNSRVELNASDDSSPQAAVECKLKAVEPEQRLRLSPQEADTSLCNLCGSGWHKCILGKPWWAWVGTKLPAEHSGSCACKLVGVGVLMSDWADS